MQHQFVGRWNLCETSKFRFFQFIVTDYGCSRRQSMSIVDQHRILYVWTYCNFIYPYSNEYLKIIAAEHFLNAMYKLMSKKARSTVYQCSFAARHSAHTHTCEECVVAKGEGGKCTVRMHTCTFECEKLVSRRACVAAYVCVCVYEWKKKMGKTDGDDQVEGNLLQKVEIARIWRGVRYEKVEMKRTR